MAFAIHAREGSEMGKTIKEIITKVVNETPGCDGLVFGMAE